MYRIPTQPDQTPTNLFNPDLKDHTFEYDKTGDHKSYLLPAYDFVTLPAYIAHFIAPQLADIILGKRGVKTNYEADKKELLQEIYMK